MRNVLIVLMVFITAFSISCNDSCDEGNKPTPASFFVEIVEETSGENVFENTTYTAQQITIEDLDEVAIPYRFIQNSNIIQIVPPVPTPTTK